MGTDGAMKRGNAGIKKPLERVAQITTSVNRIAVPSSENAKIADSSSSSALVMGTDGAMQRGNAGIKKPLERVA